MTTPRERLELWHLRTAECESPPEPLFDIAEDACDRIAELEQKLARFNWTQETLERWLMEAGAEERERCREAVRKQLSELWASYTNDWKYDPAHQAATGTAMRVADEAIRALGDD